MEVDLICFDSMGAKSVCTRVSTGDTKVLIDPGAAAMQSSYPMSDEKKQWHMKESRRRIQEAGKDSEHIVISHYHYDHHFLPDFSQFEIRSFFEGSNLWIKDPNRWINDSQWGRSRKFIQGLCEEFEGDSFESLLMDPKKEDYEDPVPNLSRAMGKNFGDYQERREELLEKWSRRFEKWSHRWSTGKWIRVPRLSIPVNFAEGESFRVGGTTVEFSRPLFHGIEYSQTGWIFATVVEDENGFTLIHTSDLQGPTIEDYADWIIEKDPDYLILDGPATYLYGYMLNKTNLKRSVENAVKILRESDIETFIYDHHLLRERKYRDRTRKFWKAAGNSETEVGTAAEIKGLKPKILQISGD
ncbi:MAG: MBL fold metallo-hydrolase [Candidatus Hadarchaeota archaeon]